MAVLWWRKTQRGMWSSFWKNCVGPATRGFSLHDRCKMLNRCVRPALHFRNTRWPYTTSLAEEQSRIQRSMLSQFLYLERLPTDDDRSYHRRRMRTVASVARQYGVWGEDHARRVVTWAQHLQRPRNGTSLASILFRWHTAEWLQRRRRDALIGQNSRLGTRLCSGPLFRRWDESVTVAEEVVARL